MALPNTITFGRVPPPANLQRHIITKPYAWDNLGPRAIKAVVLHTTLGGELMTTERYFEDPASAGYKRALTDFGVARAGYARQWNELTGNRAPHASGPYLRGGADGIQYVDRYGINAINRDGASLEFEGITFDADVPAVQLVTGIQLIAWVIDRFAGLPWNVWPRRPDGVAALLYHWEFCGRPYKLCPGRRIERLLDDIMDGVRDQLIQHQTGDYPDIPWFDPDPSAFAVRSLPPRLDKRMQVINGHQWVDITDRRVTVTAPLAPRLKYAIMTAPAVGQPFVQGRVFTASHVVAGDMIADSPLWWVRPQGDRIPMSMTTPRLDLHTLST